MESINIKCPKCGSDKHYVSTTLKMGPGNATTYHCANCGFCWENISTSTIAPTFSLATPCMLCGEPIPVGNDKSGYPRICNKCKEMWKQIMEDRKNQALKESLDAKEEIIDSNTMIHLKGEEYCFRCTCSCNVFSKIKKKDEILYKCNSCGTLYKGEAADEYN